MSFFNKLHDSKEYIISKEIDEFLKEHGYTEGTTVGHGDNCIGLQQWFCGELYDTHVCIYRDKIYFYKDLNCGGYEGDNVIDVPSYAISNLEVFKEFIDEVFDRNKWLFDEIFK